jgi:predicted  nucleic acid-binding Zn-ribbon protein
MMPGNQGNTKGDGLYKYNPAVEKIRTSFQNSEVAQLKAEVSRLKEELDAAQKVIADLHQQNQALRQKVLTPEKCDRFLTESFRVTEFP